MIYRVAERAVGWWLGSGRGRPAGSGQEATEAIARRFFFFFRYRRPTLFAMFGGAFWRGGRGGRVPLSLNPLPAPVSAEGITDTEIHVFDGRVAKYGPGQKLESFCPILGNNYIFSSSVSPAREATF